MSETVTSPKTSTSDAEEEAFSTLDEINEQMTERFSSGWEQVDQVLGSSKRYNKAGDVVEEKWGYPRGKVLLLGGESGLGKTRFLTRQAINLVEDMGRTVGVAQGEMTKGEYKEMVMNLYRMQGRQPSPSSQTRFVVGNQKSRKWKTQLKVIRDHRPDLWVIDSYNMLDMKRTNAGIEELIFGLKEVIGQHTCVILIVHLNNSGDVKENNHIQYMSDGVFMARRHPTIPRQFTISAPEKNRCGATGIEAHLRMVDGDVEVLPDPIRMMYHGFKWCNEHEAVAS